MKHIKYISLVILFSHFLSKQISDDFCEDHVEVKDLKECFNRKVDPHHFCCGLKITTSEQTSLFYCKELPSTNISFGLFKEHLMEEFKGQHEFICPEIEEKIEGKCSEFKGYPVNDGNKCLSLIGDTDKTCCSIKYEMGQKIEEFPFPSNYTECISLPNTKKKLDEEIENIKGRFNYEGLKLVINCGNVNKSGMINYFSSVSLFIICVLFF